MVSVPESNNGQRLSVGQQTVSDEYVYSAPIRCTSVSQ